MVNGFWFLVKDEEKRKYKDSSLPSLRATGGAKQSHPVMPGELKA
jgi:hypothetical protein